MCKYFKLYIAPLPTSRVFENLIIEVRNTVPRPYLSWTCSRMVQINFPVDDFDLNQIKMNVGKKKNE